MAGNIRIWPAILPAAIMVWQAILLRPYLSCRPYYLQPQLDRSAIINACKSFDLLGNPVQPAKHEPYLNQSAIISKECKLPSSRLPHYVSSSPRREKYWGGMGETR